LAHVLFSKISRKKICEELIIYECSPVWRGLALWLKKNAKYYNPCGYFPDKPFGIYIDGLRNEDLENLTLPDESVDIWIHLDVLEHLFEPFKAIMEIYRTLKKGGLCLFTAPTYPDLMHSRQVAFKQPDGSIKIEGEPEYHGNPYNIEGSLVTWRYGYDLPLLLQRESEFSHIEVVRFQSKRVAVCGIMNEVYVLIK